MTNTNPELEKSFVTTTKLILGTTLSQLDKFEDWISERISKGETVKSVIGSGTTYLPNYAFFGKIPREKIVSWNNLQEAEKRKIEISGIDEAEPHGMLAAIMKKLKQSALFVPDFVEGTNINVTETTEYLDCINVYKSFDIFSTRNCAFSFSTINSESLFGCYRVADSKFCMKCYNITNVSASMEMDLARGCSNSMFCHNVENVHNSMFCFNVKNKNYAIGNVEVGRENYMKVKEQVCKEISEELEKTRRFGNDIYNTLGKHQLLE